MLILLLIYLVRLVLSYFVLRSIYQYQPCKIEVSDVLLSLVPVIGCIVTLALAEETTTFKDTTYKFLDKLFFIGKEDK